MMDVHDGGGAAMETTRLLLPSLSSSSTDGDASKMYDADAAKRGRLFVATGLSLLALVVVGAICISHRSDVVDRTRGKTTVDYPYRFPSDFAWGAATASYQVEGGAREGGRGPSIWDEWCDAEEGGRDLRNCNGDNGDVTDDHYHRWREDVELMSDLGLRAYRFSISWSRVLPSGTVVGGGDSGGNGTSARDGRNNRRHAGINREGIDFYNRIIDALLERGIEPFVTLYHWDLPQALEDEYGGWTSPNVVEDFGNYARVCFDAFGDRVKKWITINEGWTVALHGYEEGSNAPGFRGKDIGGTGDMYLVGHHLLLAHAEAVGIFRNEGYGEDGAVIGITNSGDYRYPLDPESEGDVEAATRAMEFQLGWMTDPVWLGDYPASMRRILGDRLPQFTQDERRMLLGSADFLGLNHYSSAIASKPAKPPTYGGYWADQNVDLSNDPKWKTTDMGWNVVPDGAREMLLWIDERYDHPLVYVTENGMAAYEPDFEHSMNDRARVDYMEGYIRGFGQALGRGVNLRGYFAWSLFDNFEWQYGLSKRFGIVHVNYTTLVRTPKLSAEFYSSVIESNGDILPK